MQGKQIFCVVAILAAACCSSFARLGETPQAIENRYGPPVATASFQAFTRSQYEMKNFLITIFYRNGVSVMETFAKRGLDADTAVQVVTLVATHTVGSPDRIKEDQIRQAAGITSKDEIFWEWATPTPVEAAFNPMECTLTFFSDPAVCGSVHQALDSGLTAGN